MEHGEGCNCPCHKTLGIMICFIGVIFLLGHYHVITQDTVDFAWPIILILIGIKKAYGKGMCSCCSGDKNK